MTVASEFTVSGLSDLRRVGYPLVIAVGGCAVIEKRSNGSSHYMGYRSRRGAAEGAQRARVFGGLTDAEVVEVQR